MGKNNLVSTLKHFPGYGNNGDTHSQIIRDKRKLSTFKSRDLLPFKAGIKAGADMITFHYESDADARKTIDVIRGLGLKVGMAVKPGTDVSVLEPFLPQLDLALVMTVEPGFGGQKFMPQMMPKVEYLRRWAQKTHASLWIQVDGGIDAVTAGTAAAAGADVLVAGSAVFGAADRQDAIEAILRSASSVGRTV